MSKQPDPIHTLYPRIWARCHHDQLSPDDPRWGEVEQLVKLQQPRISPETVKQAIDSVKNSADECCHIVGIIHLFAAHVFEGEPIEAWVFEELARRLYDATVFKSSLSETLPLPWAPRSSASKAERNEVLCDDISAAIENGAAVVAAIQSEADRYLVSFETAKVVYYAHLKERRDFKLNLEQSMKIIEALNVRSGSDTNL